MKKTLFQILIIIPILSFAQNYEIPEIDWKSKTESENAYVDLLNLKDENSLIVKIGYLSHWTQGLKSEFIVFQNNGEVLRYITYIPNSTNREIKVKRKRIRKKHYRFYWNYLNECVTENRFDIDKSKLNITKIIDEKKGTVTVQVISDGTNYSLEICQRRNFIAYGSYSPESYIREKYPGWKERKKLVDLINGFENLTETY